MKRKRTRSASPSTIREVLPASVPASGAGTEELKGSHNYAIREPLGVSGERSGTEQLLGAYNF
jgi:hypothetical protein